MKRNSINALKPKGNAIKLSLKSIIKLVLPKNPTIQEEETAKMLAVYWKKVTGIQLHQIFEGMDNKQNAIYFGATIQAKELSSVGTDGIVIASDGKNLVLNGGAGRGLANVVFSLLTDDLGCRFYSADCVIIPKLSVGSVVPRAYTPKLEIRDPFSFPSFDWQWSLQNRTNSPDAVVPEEWGGHVSFPGSGGHIWFNESFFVHTYHMLVPPEKYFVEHPEYYQLSTSEQHRQDANLHANADRVCMTNEGVRVAHQLCETNEDMHRIVIEKVLSVLRKKPYCRLFDVSKVDGGGTCQCAKCREVNTREGAESASMLVLVNAVAEAIAEEFPNVMITTAAYLETIRPPKTIRPRENVLIRFCNDLCAWPHPFTRVRDFEPMVKIIDEWKKIGTKLTIWDYSGNFNHYAAPMPNMDVVADNIRFWIESGAIGVMVQNPYQCDGAERDLLRAWVTAQLMFDESLDEKELTKDFICGYYGIAAKEMLEYEAHLESSGREHRHKIDSGNMGIRYSVDCDMLNDKWVEKALKIYRKALKKAINDEVLTKRLERSILSILYVKLSNQVKKRPLTKAEISEFERIAREVQFLFPGETMAPSLDELLLRWREGSNSSVLKIEPSGGKFRDSVEVKVIASSPTVWLTYTLDGSEPNYSSKKLEQGLKIDDSATLKVAAMMLGSCVGGQVASYDFVIQK